MVTNNPKKSINSAIPHNNRLKQFHVKPSKKIHKCMWLLIPTTQMPWIAQKHMKVLLSFQRNVQLFIELTVSRYVAQGTFCSLVRTNGFCLLSFLEYLAQSKSSDKRKDYFKIPQYSQYREAVLNTRSRFINCSGLWRHSKTFKDYLKYLHDLISTSKNGRFQVLTFPKNNWLSKSKWKRITVSTVTQIHIK